MALHDRPICRCAPPRSFPVFALLAWLGLALVLVLPSRARAGTPLRLVPAVIHVHSTWCGADDTLDQIADRARQAGVQAIFLTDNLLEQFEFGLPPLRHLLRYRMDYPSILSRGPEAYLQAIRVINARQQQVLLIPGAQVMPNYYWTGSLFDGTLTMHDAQKDILALGLFHAEDYRNLPAVGNPGAARWGIGSLWLLAPVVLLVPGLWLLRLRTRRVVRFQHFRASVERRYTFYGILCLAASGLLLANNFPFQHGPGSPYDAGAGLRPHQTVIDFVNAHGGLAVWMLPEAKDYHEMTVAGFRATIRTDPYPDDLLRTDRFAAFGGIYEDTTTFTDPGAGWDQLLMAYLAGQRAALAWAIGEAAYSQEGEAGKHFGTIQTVFLAETRDAQALMAALRAGRMYALQRTQEQGLVLDQFQVGLPGQPPAEAGGRLTVNAGDRPEVRAAIGTAVPGRLPVEVLVIRSGEVVQTLRGETPLSLRFTERPVPPGTNLYYRLQVRGPTPHQILSNPIFVRAAGGA